MLSGSPPRFAGLFSRLPSVGSPPTRPGHPAPSSSRPRPLGRTVDLNPGWAADLGRQTGRPQGGPEGRRVLPARARPASPRPDPHLPTLRTQSRLRSPSGEREKVPFRPPPLKGAAPPLLHPFQPGSALSPNTCPEPPKAWISPSRPLFFTRSVASRARWIGRAGLGVGFVRPVCCGCYCCWKGGSRLESPVFGASGNRPPRATG